MTIAQKLVLALALPAASIWIVGLHAAAVGQRSLREAIERTSAADAASIMGEIDRAIHARIADWRAYQCRRAWRK